MYYNIYYQCCSHIGKRRSINQDNYICNRKYMDCGSNTSRSQIEGNMKYGNHSVVGVFDGMGGEECGEIASLIAAKCARKISIRKNPIDELLSFCKEANNKICGYGLKNGVESMGTTAALLAFTKNEIVLCNIGDSKIFRFADEKLEQISVDHYIKTAYWKKPPLSQNLGIPESELAIAPYFAKGCYTDGDIYLLCSDGLTDMVTVTEIRQILIESTFENIATKLLKKALQNGGKDNITIIICKVKREKQNFFLKL